MGRVEIQQFSVGDKARAHAGSQREISNDGRFAHSLHSSGFFPFTLTKYQDTCQLFPRDSLKFSQLFREGGTKNSVNQGWKTPEILFKKRIGLQNGRMRPAE